MRAANPSRKPLPNWRERWRRRSCARRAIGAVQSPLACRSYRTGRFMKGTKFGPMVIPGQPDNSNLIALIDGKAKTRMPFGHKALPSCLRDNVYGWIFQGAKNN